MAHRTRWNRPRQRHTNQKSNRDPRLPHSSKAQGSLLSSGFSRSPSPLARPRSNPATPNSAQRGRKKKAKQQKELTEAQAAKAATKAQAAHVTMSPLGASLSRSPSPLLRPRSKPATPNSAQRGLKKKAEKQQKKITEAQAAKAAMKAPASPVTLSPLGGSSPKAEAVSGVEPSLINTLQCQPFSAFQLV